MGGFTHCTKYQKQTFQNITRNTKFVTGRFLGCSSILGMNLFGCKFCEKHDDNKKCISDQDEDKDRKNFDSLLWALVTVFQVFKKNIKF